MKLHEISDISEMTMRAGKFDSLATKYAKEYEPQLKSGKHVGDIEELKVLESTVNNELFFSLWKDDICALILKVLPEKDNIKMIRNIWTLENFRGTGLLSKMLWFLKTRLNYSRMVIGPIHSTDTQTVVAHGLSKFNKSWYKDGKIEPFSKETLNSFYSDAKPTGWLLMLENDGEFNWPKFKGTDFVYDSYDCFIE